MLGLDLSWTGSGVALWNGKKAEALTRIPTDTSYGSDIERLSYIAHRIMYIIDECRPTSIAIEGYALSRHTNLSRLGELGGIIKYLLHDRGMPFEIYSPSSIKKFATGKGNADKQMMLEAAQRIDPSIDSFDVADALHAAIYGYSQIAR